MVVGAGASARYARRMDTPTNDAGDARGLTRRGALGRIVAAGLGAGWAAGGLGAGLAGCASGRGATARATARSIRIAHLTDTHIQPELRAFDGVASCLRHVGTHRHRPDLIITGGDLVMDAFGASHDRTREQWALWKKVLADHAPCRVEHCLGNHDIWGWNKAKSKTTGEEAQWGKRWAMDELGLSSPYRAFDAGAWRVVVLDSVYPHGEGYLGKLDDAQHDWLAAELGATPADRPVVVVSHIPILAACVLVSDSSQKNNEHRVSGGEMLVDAKRVATLFSKHRNVRLCLSGHIHKVDRVEFEGVTYICDGAVSGSWWKGKKDRCDEGYGVVDLHGDGTFAHEYVAFGWRAEGA